ncbi:MAG: hypothetical protein GC165_10045 [Armatimonadetes bacterium]|nr:hypothetical protein [Armatimonadota bacterium]MBS1728526.1 hypothetical protein [Armatimonadota bacterium]
MIIYSPVIILFGIVLDLLAFVVHRITGFPLQGAPLTSLMFGFWVMSVVFKTQIVGRTLESSVPPEVQALFDDLVLRYGLKDMSLKVTSNKKPSGMLLRQVVYLPKGAIEQLSSDGIAWILAHELAHQKFFAFKPGPQKKMSRSMTWLTVFLLLVCLIVLRLKMPWYGYALCAPVFIPIAIGLGRKDNAVSAQGWDMELACDYIAMEVLGSAKGAEEVLQVLTRPSKFGAWFLGHPMIEARMKQAVDFANGVERTPYETAFVETGTGQILEELESSRKLPTSSNLATQ